MKNESRTRVAYLFGSDRQSGVVRRQDGDVINEGSTDIWRLRSDADDFVRLHVPANFARSRAKPQLDTVATIINLVTDPDLNPRVLDIARRFLRGFPGRVLNRPADVVASRRDRVHRSLAGIDGLVVPAIARFRGRPELARTAIARERVEFPAILRRPGSHNGEILALVGSLDELDGHLDPSCVYLLTSFVDCRGDEPLYHKIRLFWFGGASLVRHLIASDDWNVHGPARETIMAHNPRWIEAERALIAAGLDGLPAPARQAMVDIRARVALDFFGIDFALLPDGRALLFEANATMNFFPLSADPRFSYAAGPVAQAAAPLFERLVAGAPPAA